MEDNPIDLTTHLRMENEKLKQEIEALNRVVETYQKHLEKVINYQSVQEYRSVVAKNREAAGTAPREY